jgi:DNA-binding response OmpR family regulator
MDRKCPKIIMLSAGMDRELEAMALAAGASYCMGKPFDINMLRTIVWEFTKK